MPNKSCKFTVTVTSKRFDFIPGTSPIGRSGNAPVVRCRLILHSEWSASVGSSPASEPSVYERSLYTRNVVDPPPPCTQTVRTSCDPPSPLSAYVILESSLTSLAAFWRHIFSKFCLRRPDSQFYTIFSPILLQKHEVFRQLHGIIALEISPAALICILHQVSSCCRPF